MDTKLRLSLPRLSLEVDLERASLDAGLVDVGDLAAAYLVLARSTAARFTSLLERLPRVTGPSGMVCVREDRKSGCEKECKC